MNFSNVLYVYRTAKEAEDLIEQSSAFLAERPLGHRMIKAYEKLEQANVCVAQALSIISNTDVDTEDNNEEA